MIISSFRIDWPFAMDMDMWSMMKLVCRDFCIPHLLAGVGDQFTVVHPCLEQLCTDIHGSQDRIHTPFAVERPAKPFYTIIIIWWPGDQGSTNQDMNSCQSTENKISPTKVSRSELWIGKERPLARRFNVALSKMFEVWSIQHCSLGGSLTKSSTAACNAAVAISN